MYDVKYAPILISIIKTENVPASGIVSCFISFVNFKTIKSIKENIKPKTNTRIKCIVENANASVIKNSKSPIPIFVFEIFIILFCFIEKYRLNNINCKSKKDKLIATVVIYSEIVL